MSPFKDALQLSYVTDGNNTEQLTRDVAEATGCRLVLLDGDTPGAELDVPSGVVLVGSESNCDLVIKDSSVSGHHVRVEVVKDGIEVSDLDSTNGTFYLGSNIQTATLHHGAVITLGRTRVSIASRHTPKTDAYSNADGYGKIIGRSPAMRRLYAVLERLEKVDYTVLIQGETGVGKDLVSREIHDHSERSNAPYEVLDCGSVPHELAESELFGHTRGSFTGAVADHTGVFGRAAGGSVFLDEIAELPIELQPKLLRVLENKQFRQVGGQKTVESKARIIAATNRDLSEAVRERSFREDLYFRLNVVTLWVPPLRERREDIPALVDIFLRDMDCSEVAISPATLELFTSGYDWPGNVRELKHAIARVVSLGSLPADIESSQLDTTRHHDTNVDLNEPFIAAKKRLNDAFEADYLSSQMRRSDNNIAKAARLSDMDRSYFKRLLKRHGLLNKK